jgi:osmotically-inducible protein OsmY
VASEDVKATAENAAKAVKGVKSVTNSINVVVPVISGDVVLNEALKSVMTAFPGITAVAKDSIIILTGDVKRADLQKVMQAAQALKPKKVENMLTIK